MALRLKERLGRKFDEEIRFFKGMMQGPKTVGSIVPTSSITARKMASVANPYSDLPILELGPGTGAITKAILAHGVKPEKLVAVEYSTDFYEHLLRLYPGVNFINGDAFDLDRTLGSFKDQKFDCVVSGIPLLNFPMQARIALLENLLDRMPAGRPMVQISYGAVSPIIANPDRYSIHHFDFIVRNIPPAQLWIYRRG
ncbi:phosphatidylethanolamine/phosphatidyl-N-methylethanolamine N-methyltransferase [Rhizobium sp. BK529]|uniref:phospholipid N-methyltransferase PmtA n=1 Tax=unclassified Rhizobium TaxID=2613769 RepID=UPI00104A8A2B|nr:MULTISPECIES: class I SAM-dependent methyltransferase [unclassified Rhizobium]MBB3592827.1 phosphatidylethanolamine/phosphatidyl-N-methylethanolamine N-methyltransferase [Rhizobium sp. BK529]TCS07209.1 phosphatidylethanolamine N-methyltransferase /phosphatidyl-N-methylethanolamine N-methyltransferase [Rhizobium sp. BK418]